MALSDCSASFKERAGIVQQPLLLERRPARPARPFRLNLRLFDQDSRQVPLRAGDQCVLEMVGKEFLKIAARLVELLLPLLQRQGPGRLQQRHADLVVDHLLEGPVGHRTGAHGLEIIECHVVELPLRIAQAVKKSLTPIPPKKRRTRQRRDSRQRGIRPTAAPCNANFASAFSDQV